MREIKFRVWNVLLEKYVDPGNMMIDPVVGFNESSTDPEMGVVFEQFTGLKDKNEKEIFEGDVLIRDDKNGQWIVKWDDKCAGFLSEWNDDWKWIKSEYGPIYKVIGNIHENPELLK